MHSSPASPATFLPIGTKVFYTGDIANPSAWLEVVSVKSAGSQAYYTLKDCESGAVRFGTWDNHIGREYFGHCNPRYVTKVAYDAYRNARISTMRPAAAAVATVLLNCDECNDTGVVERKEDSAPMECPMCSPQPKRVRVPA